MSIAKRLYLLCGFLIASILFVAGLGLWGMLGLRHELRDISDVQFPAVRAMSLADMMHDGVRGAVYKTILVSKSVDSRGKEAAANEFREMTAELTKYLDDIEKLPVKIEVRAALTQVRPHAVEYIKEGQEVVKLALAGQSLEAEKELSRFEQSFSLLEQKMETLGDLIEKDANSARDLGDSALYLNIFLTLAFFISGVVFTILISRALMKALLISINQLTQEAHSVQVAASDLDGVSSRLRDSAQKQSAAIQETASSVDEIDTMVRQNAEGAAESQKTANGSESAALKGKTTVDEMVQAMAEINSSNDRIMSEVEAGNQRIAEIANVIQTISEKTKVINDIVFQTKLLSFNASVEAARAGEHGKGFAVVAEEVGGLANMSGNAAKEIGEMLEGSSKRVDLIVTETRTNVGRLLQASKASVENGVAVAHRCAGVLNEVVTSVRDVSRLSGGIASACLEQSAGISEINKAVTLLNQINTENVGASDAALRAAQEFAQRAESLSLVVTDLQRMIGDSAVSATARPPEAKRSQSDLPARAA